MARRELVDQPVDPALEIAPGDRRPHRRREDRRGQHLDERANLRADQPGQLEDVAARFGHPMIHGDRRAEGHDGARAIADGVAHHFRELARERALPLLDALPREDVVLEHEVVGDGVRHDDEIGAVGGQRGVNQSGLERFQLAAVAAPALGIEEQVVLLEHLGDVRLERDQVRGILRVAADRDGAGHVALDQAERPAEQIDPGGDQRRPDAVVVEHERLHQVVDVAPVVRDVDDAVLALGGRHLRQVLADALDLAENRVERVLQRAVHPYRCVVRSSSRYSWTRSRARALVSPPYPLCRYLTTSSRARTAWEMSSGIRSVGTIPAIRGLCAPHPRTPTSSRCRPDRASGPRRRSAPRRARA